MKTYLKFFLAGILALVAFTSAFKSCHPVELDEGTISPQKMYMAPPAKPDTEFAEKVYFTDTEHRISQVKIPKAVSVQNPTDQNFTENPILPQPMQPMPSGDIGQQRPQQSNNWDMLFNGGLGAGVLALLAYVVKADRETLKKFTEIMDKLCDSNANIERLAEENKQLLKDLTNRS